MSKAYALVTLVLATATAQAAPKQPQPTAPRPWTGYIKVPRVTPPAAAVSSRILYIKRCFGNCDIHYAPQDDSSTGASSIAAQGSVRTIGDFSQSQAVWDSLMSCVRTTFAPFDVTVTDVKPPDGTSYFMNIVGGKPTDLRSDLTNAGGVAPFSCGEIPKAITYTFDVYGPDPDALCWTVAQEIAHAFGLEHEFLQKDPMTYLSGDTPKRFRDIDAPCGEFEKFAACDCKSGPQNSYRHIVGMFGPGAPTPPDLTITYPVEGKPTQPGFVAVAQAADDVRIDKLELYVDGAMVSQTMVPYGTDKFELTTTDFGAGPHTLEIKAFDVQGVAQTATMSFTQGPACTASTVCSGSDVCVSGVCVAGPDVPGGLGYICGSDAECLSHRCADAGEAHRYCVDECDLGNAKSCPAEFSCIAAGSEGVCWPSPDAGCCDAGTGPQGPILLALGLGVLVLRRRARSSR